MKQFKKMVKTIVFSSMLAAGMMLPEGVFAQNDAPRQGSLLGSDRQQPTSKAEGLFNTVNRGANDPINHNGIGQAPLGSGIAILLVAGLGYVALKKKED